MQISADLLSKLSLEIAAIYRETMEVFTKTNQEVKGFVQELLWSDMALVVRFSGSKMVLCQGMIMRAVSTSHSFVEDKKYAKFYAALELPPDSTQVEIWKVFMNFNKKNHFHNQDNVRRKYIELAKKYHPDTPETASKEKFLAVDEVRIQ